MKILSLNAGSSTLKFAAFDMAANSLLIRGVVDRLGQDNATVSLAIPGAADENYDAGRLSFSKAVMLAFEHSKDVDAVGCRVVHGGMAFEKATLVDKGVVEVIRELAPLAPLHNARDLEVIEAVRAHRSQLPVVAVFDTTFHRTMPPVATRYAVSDTLYQGHKVQRYGFHGISYRYIVDCMANQRGTAKGRMILCHLGNGASICAALDGESIETSMGMTPLEGLVMGTRSGDIDPGAVLYVLRETEMSLAEADYLLNHESGLLGLSGTSSDVRELEKAAANGNDAAEFALDSFAYRVAKYIGSYSVVLNGLDCLVFSGGIGEHSNEMRARVCRLLGSLGISEPTLSPGSADASCISSAQNPSVWVVRTNEERQIANETSAVILATSS